MSNTHKYLDYAGLKKAWSKVKEHDEATLKEAKSYAEGSTKSVQEQIDEILKKIPNEATEENKLADKEFVNSSIATSTATFRGTVDSVEKLKELTGDLNDYAFLVITDETTKQTTRYDRYKYTEAEDETTGHWSFEYSLNNSSFTSEQWTAINSAITSELVTQITTNKNDIDTINKDLTNNVKPDIESLKTDVTSLQTTIEGLDYTANSTADKTLTGIKQVNGKIEVTFSDIAIAQNQVTNLGSDLTTIRDNIAANTQAITNETTARQTADEANLQAAKDYTDVETTRAKAAEEQIIQDTSVSFEAVKEQYESLDGEVGTLSDTVGTLNTDLQNEITRATTAEENLQQAISSAGKVDDVLVNGVSVVENKIAKISLDVSDKDALKISDVTGADVSPGFGDTVTVGTISHTNEDGSVTTKEFKITIPNALATEQQSGLMSAEDKAKLDDAKFGVTGVKGEAESDYRTGQVILTKANIGLGNVDNTSDLDKPISNATQTALADKLDSSTVATLEEVNTVLESVFGKGVTV